MSNGVGGTTFIAGAVNGVCGAMGGAGVGNGLGDVATGGDESKGEGDAPAEKAPCVEGGANVDCEKSKAGASAKSVAAVGTDSDPVALTDDVTGGAPKGV